MENKNQETLLRVDHLCQYFGATKAVDDEIGRASCRERV